jgi:hypothetical protein
MKRLAAIAFLVAAFGALMHFWPSGERSSLGPSTSSNAPPGEPGLAPTIGPATSQPSYPAQAPASRQRARQPLQASRGGASAYRHSRQRQFRRGDFSVTIEVQAPRGIRQLEFSVTYKMSILRLVKSSAGVRTTRWRLCAFRGKRWLLLVRIASGVTGAGPSPCSISGDRARGIRSRFERRIASKGRPDTVNRATAYEDRLPNSGFAISLACFNRSRFPHCPR